MSRYGAQEGPAFVNQVQCTGMEVTFDNCTKEVLNETGCSSANQGGFVYVVCQGEYCSISEVFNSYLISIKNLRSCYLSHLPRKQFVCLPS